MCAGTLFKLKMYSKCHLEEASPTAEVGERQVKAEGVDDGVDLEVDGQAEEEAG